MKMKAAVLTLGCKTNQYESQAMEKLLLRAGFELLPEGGGGAALYVINTCTVTASADKKSRQLIRRIKRENPGSFVAVCGCMAQLSPGEAERACGADFVGGNRDHAGFISAVQSRMAERSRARTGVDNLVSVPDESGNHTGFAADAQNRTGEAPGAVSAGGGGDTGLVPRGGGECAVPLISVGERDADLVSAGGGGDTAPVFGGSGDNTAPVSSGDGGCTDFVPDRSGEFAVLLVSAGERDTGLVPRGGGGDTAPVTDSLWERGLIPGGLSSRTRALLKIEDGCDYFCAYCIIPYARGRVRSMPVETAAAHAAALSAEGYREIVLTGIEISEYGKDLPGNPGLTRLVLEICRAAAPARVALGSLRPSCVDEDFCKALSGAPNLCRHFHLSVQSGSAGVLKRMNRRYTPDAVREAVGLLRKYFDAPNITGDIICGFPGETEEEFLETLGLVSELSLCRIHVFPYSARRGTAAEKLENSVSKAKKSRRCGMIHAKSMENYYKYLDARRGEVLTVLAEDIRDGVAAGYAENYAYTRVFGAPEARRGEMIKALVTGRDGENLLARAVLP